MEKFYFIKPENVYAQIRSLRRRRKIEIIQQVVFSNYKLHEF